MRISVALVTFLACLIQMINFGSALRLKSPIRRALSLRKRSGQSGGSADAIGYLSFVENQTMKSETFGQQFHPKALTCVASGIPQPSIHWLKNGQRIGQDGCDCSVEQELVKVGPGLGSTKSVLYLDCLDQSVDEANYTCVAETAMQRLAHTTVLRVERTEEQSVDALLQCAAKSKPARITMASDSLLGQINEDARLFCRATGNPKPRIVWYGPENELIEDGARFKVESNGDLIIKNISWSRDMGGYTCEAVNDIGLDYAQPFLYPTESDSRLPLW